VWARPPGWGPPPPYTLDGMAIRPQMTAPRPPDDSRGALP
jgi:hypothetical protein